VTNIPERAVLVMVFIAVVALAVFMMRRAWLAKLAVQSEIVEPSAVPSNFVAVHRVEGRYLASSAASAWLTRITVHQLGVPSRAALLWSDAGVVVERPSSRSFFIPRVELVSVRADRAIAGRAFEKDGIAVLTWKLGEIFVDSGFRADSLEGHLEVVKMMSKQESGL
jgi:hypothetical protein